MMSVRAKVTGSGRLDLPSELRQAVGLERGGDVVVELAGRELRIRTVDEVLTRSQELTRELLADKPGASVDDFLAGRRGDTDGG